MDQRLTSKIAFKINLIEEALHFKIGRKFKTVEINHISHKMLCYRGNHHHRHDYHLHQISKLVK